MKEYYCNASFPVGITCMHKIDNICGGGLFCDCKEKSKKQKLKKSKKQKDKYIKLCEGVIYKEIKQ